jgi:RNA polymerase sigma factor (sigma-70 family)
VTFEPSAESLYEAHRPALLSYAKKLSGDPAVAEDIVQDAWLLFDNRPMDPPVRQPLAYLRRIVRNLVFAQFRRRQYEGATGQTDIANVMDRIPDETPSVEVDMIARDELRSVMNVIDGLPERQIAAFKMYYFEEMTLREIALKLGLSTSRVHVLVTDAIARCDAHRSLAE